MAEPQEIKSRDIIEFYTELPDLEDKQSPPLYFVGVEWILRFHFDEDNAYFAYLSPSKSDYSSSYNSDFRPFKFDFRVAFMDGNNSTIVHKGCFKVTTKSNIKYYIWELSENKMQSILPPYYNRRGNFIQFSFAFLLPIEPVLQFKSRLQDKGVQTSPYMNADECMGSLSKDFSKLLDTGFNHDATIKCGEHSIKVHKTVVCARSDVFKAMLESDMLEGRTGRLEIQDMDVSHLQDFVKYLYTDALPELTFVKAKALYEAGDMYAVRSLMLRCSEYLKDSLSLENVFECFALANAHSDQKLKDEVISYFKRENLSHGCIGCLYGTNTPK